MLYELESGNSTLATGFLDEWSYDPTLACGSTQKKPSRSDELGIMVICSDSYDAPQPDDGLDWWDDCEHSKSLNHLPPRSQELCHSSHAL